jgi:hypothetical protein
MKFLLRRFAESADGTFGHLRMHSFDLCTCEEEDRNNERGESRIPAGTYTCRRSVYYRHGHETFEVTGVQNRSRILFHPGNTEEDSDGCILPGMDFGMVSVVDEETGERRKKLGVVQSRDAFWLFMQALDGVDLTSSS